MNGSFDGLFVVPTYTLGTTILGAVPSFSMAFIPAYSAASANVGLGPLSISRSDSVWGGSDLYPTAQLFWNKGGVNNFMAYLTGDIPVGSYDPDRLANIGIGHGAIDGGGAYTYLNTKTGTEFSATLGFTGNFENPSTNYTNGIDSHLDLAASQFLNQQLFVGAVGYVYQQLTPDRGQRAILGRTSRARAGSGRRSATISQVNGTTSLYEPPRLLGVRLLSQASGPFRLRDHKHPAVGVLCEHAAFAVRVLSWCVARPST